jgi:predicted esterase
MSRVAALVVTLALSCRREPTTTTTLSPPAASSTSIALPPPAKAKSTTSPPSVTSDWCIEGLTAIDEETCYLLPPLAEGKPRRLLVYLHGVVPPLPESTQQKTVQTAVRDAATQAGAAALVPRGTRGIGPGEAHDWYAWPTDPATHEKLAPSILAHIVKTKAMLESILGAPFERTYLAGSSNGAYFLTALALRGDPEAHGLHLDGYGAMSGGAGGRAAPPTPVPFYIGYGDYDPETKANVRSLVSSLEAAKWPLRVAVHPFGHGARKVYLDEAFAFWDETR